MANRYVATGNGIEVPLAARTLDAAITEVELGGRRFRAWQTFDILDQEAGEEVAVMIDIKEPFWLEEWGDPEAQDDDQRTNPDFDADGNPTPDRVARDFTDTAI